MSKALDDAREQLRKRLREREAARLAPPTPPRPELFTKDQTCGSCMHRGDEVIGPSCKVALGLYHCKLRPSYDWQSPLAECRFQPSRYQRRS